MEDEDEDGETPEINMPLVKASALSKAVEFMTHFAADPMPELPQVS